MPRPASLPYTAAKAALTAYSKGLAKEAGPHGIRINVLPPGLIRTEALDTRMASLARQAGAEPEAVLDRTVAAMDIPLARAGTAGEVADSSRSWPHPPPRTLRAASSRWTAEPCPRSSPQPRQPDSRRVARPGLSDSGAYPHSAETLIIISFTLKLTGAIPGGSEAS
jgi:Enoyl-(Acyl carrier protein) reductase